MKKSYVKKKKQALKKSYVKYGKQAWKKVISNMEHALGKKLYQIWNTHLEKSYTKFYTKFYAKFYAKFYTNFYLGLIIL